MKANSGLPHSWSHWLPHKVNISIDHYWSQTSEEYWIKYWILLWLELSCWLFWLCLQKLLYEVLRCCKICQMSSWQPIRYSLVQSRSRRTLQWCSTKKVLVECTLHALMLNTLLILRAEKKKSSFFFIMRMHIKPPKLGVFSGLQILTLHIIQNLSFLPMIKTMLSKMATAARYTEMDMWLFIGCIITCQESNQHVLLP